MTNNNPIFRSSSTELLNRFVDFNLNFENVKILNGRYELIDENFILEKFQVKDQLDHFKM
jgi:hypothetical protein